MTNTSCKGLCERFAIRILPGSGHTRVGLLKKFANWDNGEKRCRPCECVYSSEQNLLRCPCCGQTLAKRRMHGDKKKIETIARY